MSLVRVVLRSVAEDFGVIWVLQEVVGQLHSDSPKETPLTPCFFPFCSLFFVSSFSSSKKDMIYYTMFVVCNVQPVCRFSLQGMKFIVPRFPFPGGIVENTEIPSCCRM